MGSNDRTSVAVLGTLAEFHRDPIPYDLGALIGLVDQLRPDLLCLDLTSAQWQRRDFADLPPEYREALLPLAHQTDIVVVPIAEDSPPPEPSAPGFRGKLINIMRSWLADIQRTAPGPAAANSGWRHFLADLLYGLIALVAGDRSWLMNKVHIEHLVEHALEVARNNPGCRILIVANVRYCHHIRHKMRRIREFEVVTFDKL